MIHAYDEVYLANVRDLMGNMLDIAVNELDYSIGDFYARFLNSIASVKISRGDPAYIAGKTSLDLILEILEWEELPKKVDFPMNKSSEYWAGWALAYYQWHTAISFQTLNEEIPIESIVGMYHPYHEMDINQFVDRVNEIRQAKRVHSYLKAFRMKMGYTQNELAEITQIPVKTIQQYEQRQKNINNANVEYIINLSKALCCSPTDLLER